MTTTNRKIYDSVHGFIHIDDAENELIESAPFQRLRYIHQLGVAFFVYPGSTNRRFEHSLGVMELATAIYDQITKSTHESIPKPASSENIYWRKILRMAALSHDFGHLPFSHVAEYDLLGEKGHEYWTMQIIGSSILSSIWQKIKPLNGHDVAEDIVKISLGPKRLKELHPMSKVFSPWERVVSEIITGDFFGADRIDYLLRDARYTGLPYGSFDYHQLIEMLTVLPALNSENVIELGIEENGIESAEALLLGRRFMHKRIYQYSSVKEYAFHLSEFMKKVYSDDYKEENLEYYLRLTDSEVIAEWHRAIDDPTHKGHEDAQYLLKRKPRFKAIGLQYPITEKKLKELSIPSDKIAWDLTLTPSKTLGLRFPVLMLDGRIKSGEEVSEISIPVGSKNWIFVAPEFETQLRKALNND